MESMLIANFHVFAKTLKRKWLNIVLEKVYFTQLN